MSLSPVDQGLTTHLHLGDSSTYLFPRFPLSEAVSERLALSDLDAMLLLSTQRLSSSLKLVVRPLENSYSKAFRIRMGFWWR